MHSRKYYDFEPRGNAGSGRDSERTRYTTKMYIDPKDGKIDRENYLTKEDSRHLSENVTKSVVTRSVIDKRSSSSYKTRENSRSIKTRGLKGVTSTYSDPSKFTSSDSYGMNEDGKEAPISSFYSSYSKDEDLSEATKFDKSTDNGGNVISSFYRSGGELNVSNQGARTDEEHKDVTRATRHEAVSSGLNEIRGGSRTYVGKEDSSQFPGRSSLERRAQIDETASANATESIGQEDINILRRALERKQASNSLERVRISNRLSGDDCSDPLKYTTSAHVSLSDKWKDKDSGSSRISVGVSDDRDYDWKTTSAGINDSDVPGRLMKEDMAHSRRSIDSVHFPGKIQTRSLSADALDNKERSRLGIYQELPGRKEFMSHTAKVRPDDDKELSRESSRTGSLERDTRRKDYTDEEPFESHGSLHRLRSKSSEELRSYDEDIYPSYRSRYLYRQGNSERQRVLGGDDFSCGDIARRNVGSYSPRKEPSTHNKLREDIARLKAETETRAIKKGEMISPYPVSREPSIQDKLKEDIARLKAETLTREHSKPYIPPSSSRVESKDGISSRWKSREPSIQDKLKDDIAKLKADTRDFPSLPRNPTGMTTRDIRPDDKVDDKRDVRQSGTTTSSFGRYVYSNKEGSDFKDEIRRKETQRYGDPEHHKQGETSLEDGALRMHEATIPRDGRTTTERKFKDTVHPGYFGEYYRPTNFYDDASLRRPSDGEQPWSRKPDDVTPRTDERRLIEREDSLISPRNVWDEPTRTSRESRSGSTQGYATKRVFRADSTVSMTSTKNGEHGPSSVRGFFHGSVSEEDQSAYYSKGMDNKGDSYSSELFRQPSETSKPPEPFRKPEASNQPETSRPPEPPRPTQPTRKPGSYRSSEPYNLREPSRQTEPAKPPEPSTQPDKVIPLSYPGQQSNIRKREDSIVSVRGSEEEPRQNEEEKREVHSNSVQTSREFVTRKTTREDSVVSRRSSDDRADVMPSRIDTARRMSDRSELSPRRTSIREEIDASEESMIFSPKEVVQTTRKYRESRPSGMSELRKKIEQLKSKVDTLDDSRSRGRLEQYVDEHSEKKPDVDIKDPVHIPRYQPSARLPDRGSEADGVDPTTTRASTDFTSESINRQFSRQTSVASTVRRISSICEEDAVMAPRSSATDKSPDELFPKVEEKPKETPAVLIQTRDAETMTAPEIQEHVGTDRLHRLDSIISEIVQEPKGIEELRGVPIEHRETEPGIQQVVDTGDVTDSGVTTIQIDTQKQRLSSDKDKQRWWDAFTAEDVDRLLEIGNRGRWNAYTAEDMDKMWQLGPARRRSFRRGSYERRSFRRHPRRSKDDVVDVHVRVRGRQETCSRPLCITAKAAPEEKAIVLRDAKESADPFIRKIKVDDVYGADAVRVENGVVKIKVGDLTTRGRKAWARILQQKDRIVESDGTVIIPVSRDHYEDGVYYTNYSKGQDQDGAVRIPIKLKIQEDNRLKTKKLRVGREMKRAGSMRRTRRAAGRRAYIVGARYYHNNMLMSADGYGSQAQQQRMVWRTQRDSSKVAGNEIVVRGSQPYAVPMRTVQRIHAGHKTTRQAASCRNEDGKMVITVHAIPAQPPKFNLQQVGENMAQPSDNSSGRRNVSSTSRSYYVTSGSGRHGYATHSTSSRQGISYIANSGSDGDGYTTYSTSGRQGTSYIVTDPSDSYPRRSSGLNGVSRVYTSNQIASSPTIVPYEDGRQGNYGDSFIADPSSFHDSSGTRMSVSDARVNARTAYGEKFNLQDHGNISKVQYVNGVRQGSRIINDKRWANGRYRYGSSWNSKQQEKLNGRSMAWAVEEVAPDF